MTVFKGLQGVEGVFSFGEKAGQQICILTEGLKKQFTYDLFKSL